MFSQRHQRLKSKASQDNDNDNGDDDNEAPTRGPTSRRESERFGTSEEAEQSSENILNELQKDKDEHDRLQVWLDESLKMRELKVIALQRRNLAKNIWTPSNGLNKARHNRFKVDKGKFKVDKDSLDHLVADSKRDRDTFAGNELMDLKKDKERLKLDLVQCIFERDCLESEHQYSTKRINELEAEKNSLQAKLEEQGNNMECLRKYFVQCIQSQEDQKKHVQEMLDKCVMERDRMRLELDLRREAMDILMID